jgi:hypothetical protein
MKESADSVLSKRIFEVLRQKKLLPEKKIAELQKKYSTGSFTREDWILIADVESEKREVKEDEQTD